MASRGVVYIAFGKNAREEATKSIQSLKRHNNLDVVVVSNKALGNYNVKTFDSPGWGARQAKLSIHRLVPWDDVLYLDADTRVKGDLSIGFDILADGWDLIITPSEHQNESVLQHVNKEGERAMTLDMVPSPLQLQGGVFWFNRTRCYHMFEEWRNEWQRWKNKDQAALLRALEKEPVRVWLLGRQFNGGNVVEHLFGRAR